MHQGISSCRLCDNTQLVEILDLGLLAFSDIFPKQRTEHVAAGPLKLVKCMGDSDVCGSLQLAYCQSAGRQEGSVRHHLLETFGCVNAGLSRRVRIILERLDFIESAALSSPVATSFGEHGDLVPGLLSVFTVQSRDDGRNAIITPLAMLSSGDRPFSLLQRIHDHLEPRSVCVLEEPYMPSMIRVNAYDAVCHQHAVYFGLRQIKWLLDRAQLKIVNIQFDPGDDGTIAIALATRESPYEECGALETVLDAEASAGLHTASPYTAFAHRVISGIELLRAFFDGARRAGKSVSAIGASKEGNVILQSCRATEGDIRQIGDRDPTKVGAFTPGTLLPIVAEDDVLAERPSFVLVLPWRMREVFLSQRKFFGYSLLFALPRLEVVHPSSFR